MIRDIEQWISELRTSKKLVVVEGPKDQKALLQCGIRNVAVLSKQALYATAERIASEHASVVLLTDFDKKGKALYGALKKQFQRLGVKVDTRFREFLQRETTLSHIEGLHTYINNSVNHNNVNQHGTRKKRRSMGA